MRLLYDAYGISIHAPPRGATRPAGAISRILRNFNSRPSARGDTTMNKTILKQRVFQFTPLREGRPCRFACCFLAFCISIHAPPRGATPFCVLFSCLLYFNSRPSARGDLVLVGGQIAALISIHAPPRGATMKQVAMWDDYKFQFTPLREGRPDFIVISAGAAAFQFTPLREGRPMRSR